MDDPTFGTAPVLGPLRTEVTTSDVWGTERLNQNIDRMQRDGWEFVQVLGEGAFTMTSGYRCVVWRRRVRDRVVPERGA